MMAAEQNSVASIAQRIDFADVMSVSEVSQLLRRSPPTVRALTLRRDHPLPCVNTGLGKKKHRIFIRASVLRWLEEEESISM